MTCCALLKTVNRCERSQFPLHGTWFARQGRCEQMAWQSGYRYYDLGTYHRDTPLNGVLPYTVTELAAGSPDRCGGPERHLNVTQLQGSAMGV
jgi:hypothetical protein